MKPENGAAGGSDGEAFYSADLIRLNFLLDPQQNSRLFGLIPGRDVLIVTEQLDLVSH